MKRVFIFGSCVSRDAISFADPNEVSLAAYFARCSFASLGSQPVADEATLQAIDSKFQRRMVAADMDKTVLAEVQKGEFDLLLVDFIDERFHVLKLNAQQRLTISNEYKKARNGIYDGTVLNSFSTEKFSHWKSGFDRFIAVLRDSGQLPKLRILRVFWSYKTVLGQDIDTYSREYIDQQNAYLTELYRYVSETVGEHYLIKFSEAELLADPAHKWGPEPFHYSQDFNRHVLNRACSVASTNEYLLDRKAIQEAHAIVREYQAIANNSARAECGRALFKEKMLKLPFFDAFQLGDILDWECDPFENRTWQWQLNWFAFITDAIAYDYANPDVNHLFRIIAFIKSWANKYLNQVGDCVFEFAWHDHGTAKRVEQVLLLINHIDHQYPDFFSVHPELMKFLNHFLYVHAEFLSQERFYSKHTNHGLEQARVLLLLSILLAKSFYAQQWKVIAVARLNSELNFSFTSEGVHVENSPAYHYFVLKVFLQIISDYRQYDLEELASCFENISRKALYYLTFIIHPDGTLPLLGDTEAVRVGDVFFDYFGELPEYRYFQYVHSKGRTGEPAPVNSYLCPISGYGIIRNGWGDRRNFINASHLVLKAGCISQYHSHQDDGSIIYFARGEHWLVDSGMFNHNRNAPIRKYMRSRQAHNVVQVQTAPYATKWEDIRSSWRVDVSETGTFRMHSTVYEGIELCRSISWNDGSDAFEVTDEIHVIDGRCHDVDVLWHLDSNKVLETETETETDHVFLFRSLQSNQVLSMKVHDGQTYDFVCWTGNDSELGLSVMSRKKNLVEDTTTLKLRLKGVSGYRKIVCTFSFVEKDDR